MTFKKVLSVFLAAVMLIGVFSIGLTGLAASINYAEQYKLLAEALQNDHVRDLTNYEIQNIPLKNETKGFVTEANGFGYEHRVLAKDDKDGSILKAANRFYYIAENLISTVYGQGCYDASTLIAEITENITPYFSGAGEEVYYEDFYGKKYTPTEEELAKYQETVELIEAAGREVTQASLTAYNVFFMEKDYYAFYNVDTILSYFVGGTLKINAGNWFHTYSFCVRSSVNSILENSTGLNSFPDDEITIRGAMYVLSYSRTMDETGTKAFYAFKEPSADDAADLYKDTFGPAAQTVLANDEYSIGYGGQASELFVTEHTDRDIIPYLAELLNWCTPYFVTQPDSDGNPIGWDIKYASKNETELAALDHAAEIIACMEAITEGTPIPASVLAKPGNSDLTPGFDVPLSNKALMKVFGNNLGDMITLTYILKPISQSPRRIVRGNTEYVADANKLNAIVRDMDALVASDATDPARKDISKRVGTIVSQFFDTTNSLFEGTSVEGMAYTDLHELVKHLVTGLLFRDSIVNMLVELLYPMIVDLLEEKVYGAILDALDAVPGLAGILKDLANDLIDNIITKNQLAIYPNTLADRIDEDDKDKKFSAATAVLRAAGKDWNKVNFDAISWGVEDAPYDKKAELFVDALCAGLGGFVRAVVTVMCGDAQYTDQFYGEDKHLEYDDDQFNEYYDKYLINLLGVKGYLRSQGGYTKLIIPLFRVLGLTEVSVTNYTHGSLTGYVSPRDYHRLIANGGNYQYDNSLRLILEPIIYWVENVLGNRPFETLWKLIPNLVYFFTRKGTSPTPLSTIQSNLQDDAVSDRTHGGITDGVPQFEQLQSYNLLDILDSVFLSIQIKWGLVEKNINIGSIANLIDKDELLGSVNGLLNEVLNLEYVVGESGVLNTVAYANSEGIAVMPDSFEYATNSAAYPIALQYVYANENETEYRANPDDTHQKEITNPEYIKASYKIPALQESKLTSVSALDAAGNMVDPNAIGVLNTAWNTIDVLNPGVVLMYVLRFVLSALGYRFDLGNTELPMLIECFGLDINMELFQGLNLSDIIYNVMLHPDSAICALLELFYSNEKGNEYEGESYSYPPTKIDYHGDVLLDESINPGKVYGTKVRYSQYWTEEYAKDTLDNIDPLATNILGMLDVEIAGVKLTDGLGGFLKDLLNEKVFNNELMNTLFNTIYQLLGGLNETVGFDIETVLDAALGVTYEPGVIGRTIDEMLGTTDNPAAQALKELSESGKTWSDFFADGDVTLDWGIDTADQPHYQFLKVAAALLAPAAFAIRFLFMDQHLDILGLIDLDSYAGYHYAFIGLLEALSCTNILTYREYYEKGEEDVSGTLKGDANTIYYLLSPVLGLLDNVYVDPITTVLSLIPNLLFFISIGGLNDLLNNLVHFAYVLLDILKPIVNGYDLLGGLLSNIDISGFKLNLSLPLNVDFNSLISELLDTLVGDSLTIEGVSLHLPYIDFHTLCCGTLTGFASKEVRQTVHLDSLGGGALLTAVFRLALEFLYLPENRTALRDIITNLINSDKLDDFDGETLLGVLDMLINLLQTYEIPDMLLFAVYFLVTKLTPISGVLKDKLQAKGMTITQLFEGDFSTIVSNVIGLVAEEDAGNTGDVVPTEDIITNFDQDSKGGFWKRLVDFFKKIGLFFKKLFGIA